MGFEVGVSVGIVAKKMKGGFSFEYAMFGTFFLGGGKCCNIVKFIEIILFFRKIALRAGAPKGGKPSKMA